MSSATPAVPAPFIVGVSRSGTTLLRLMLDAHPQLAIPPESRFIPGLIDRIGLGASPEAAVEFLISWERWSDFHLDADALRDRMGRLDVVDAGQATRCFFELYAEQQGKPRWGDKSPPYVNHVAVIADALPEAVFIHLIRDGRDVCVSMMRRRHSMRHPKPIARRWVAEVTNARVQGSGLAPGRYVEVRYEDLTADPEAVLRRLCEPLELEWDPAMLDYHSRAADRLAELSDIRLASGELRTAEERMIQFEGVVKPVTGGRTGAWRTELSDSGRRRFESVAGELLRDLGYPTQ